MTGNKDQQQQGGKTGQHDMKREESGHRSGEAGRSGGQHQPGGAPRDQRGEGGLQDNRKGEHQK